jgi:hypothetical protein
MRVGTVNKIPDNLTVHSVAAQELNCYVGDKHDHSMWQPVGGGGAYLYVTQQRSAVG